MPGTLGMDDKEQASKFQYINLSQKKNIYIYKNVSFKMHQKTIKCNRTVLYLIQKTIHLLPFMIRKYNKRRKIEQQSFQ